MEQPKPGDLARIPLFAGLSEEQLAALAERFEVETFPAGHSPVRTGTHGYVFFVLAAGTAHAELDGQLLERLEPGAVFGEMAFFAPSSRRSATIVPETDITVFSMFGTQFRQMQLELPEVAHRLEDLVHERLERSHAASEDHG